MITIVKDSSKLVVTKGTYEEQYKKLGYQIASEKKEATKEVASFIEEVKEVKEDNQEKTLKDISQEDNQEKEDLGDKYGLNLSKKTNTSRKGKK